MSYPKYLTAKSLEKRYRDSGISADKIQFIKDFCMAAMHLYGMIHAEQLWDVYKELAGKSTVPKLQRKELYAVLGILRREDMPYYVFEADEVYTEEPRSDKYRILASKKLVGKGYGKMATLYRLMDSSQGKPYYVPENMLEFKDEHIDERAQSLEKWLSDLTCTLTEYETSWGKTFECKYTGKKLGEFSFISRHDDFEISYFRGEIGDRKGNPKLAEEYEQELNSMNAAQRVLRDYTWMSQIDGTSPTESLKYLNETLAELGVALSMEQMEYLLNSLMDYHNHLHLWCNCGWTPEELSKKYFQSDLTMPKIQFGPGIEKAFADGDMDRNELISKLEEMGIEVL